jgi:hypothetical protein
MTPLTITPDIERAPWTDLDPEAVTEGTLERIGLLRNGTAQGRATVALVVKLDDGSHAVVETTWRLLRAAVRALSAGPVGSEETDD